MLFSNASNIIFLKVFLLSALFCTLITIPVRRIGYKFSLLDKPNNRKKQNLPIVRIGGISIFLTSILGIIYTSISPLFDNTYQISSEYLIEILIIPSLIIFLVGLLDDFSSISPLPRLYCQILVATLCWFNGFKINSIDLSIFSLENLQVHPILSLFLTIIWIVGIINAINWFDGLDGLAAGFSLINLIGFSLISLSLDKLGLALICFIFAGACLGFLYHNFNNASIYMGDSGSNFLGIILALLSITCTSNLLNNNSFQIGTINPIYPIILLSLPIFDMTRVIITRLINCNSPFYPDNNHIHHKLLEFVNRPIKAVIFIYFLTSITTLICIGLIDKNYISYFFAILFSLFVLVFSSIIQKKFLSNFLKK